VGETVERTVYFRYSTNCKQRSVAIKVKNCGSFYIYRLVPTVNQYAYTVASEPCDSDPMVFDQEDRSIYTRSTSMLHDNGIKEGWYQFTTGNGVMAKSPPMAKSCRATYPVWMDGADPSPGEGVVTRTICSVNGATPCNWRKEIQVRNCGDNKMLYYFTTSPPHTSSRYCVDDSMDNVCKGAKILNDAWRGSSSSGTGHADRLLPEGWYRFNTHNKRMASFPVPSKTCGSTYPIYMRDEHVGKGECKSQYIFQVYSDTNYNGWKNGYIYECQCMNGDYIYYHVPNVAPLSSHEGSYCVEEEPCKNFDRYTGGTRSPWSNALVTHGDNTSPPTWVKIDTGLKQMPMYTPETKSCGATYPAWYDGALPKQVGVVERGRYCFVTSATAKCSSPKDAQVQLCDGGYYVYHVVPTPAATYGYCADSDVCDVASEEWGREENHRLRHTSVTGYYSSTRKSDTTLGNSWFRITTGLKRMPTECVGVNSCGTAYPGWLNGEHPEPAERVVDRQVCFVTATTDGCCGKTQDIKVVSCVRDSKQFYLYRLYKTTANYGYCVDQAPDDVCKLDNSHIQYISDERHGTGHYYDSSFKHDYQEYNPPAWSEVTVHQHRLLHQVPTQKFCGGIYAGWVEDPAPGPNDGVVSSRSCYRDSLANELCYQEMPLKMTNCGGKIRYLYAPPQANNRNMCVEEDICDAASHEVFDKETWRLAFTKTEGTAYKTDYKKMSTSPYRGWFRFTGAGHNKITEVQQEFQSCGTYYPAWLNGEHPAAEDGVVLRQLSLTTAVSTYTSKKQDIFIRNCGSFMLYNVDFSFWNANWALCVDTDVCNADVTEINEDHRLLNSWGAITATDDRSLARGWYKFANGFEKMPETCPIHQSCGSNKPGYLSQPHPAIGDGIIERKVCFGDDDQCCATSRDVLVKNCGTHFVYRLYPTTTSEKYCVEEGPNTMCDAKGYTELDDDWRGENMPYDSTDKHDDNTLLTAGNWYRFTNYLGRMPEVSMSAQRSCGTYYPGYLKNKHPTRQDGIQNNQVCWSTSATNENQACKQIRVRNCGSYYVYQITKTASSNYGYCVAQDQCTDAIELDDRWRLAVNPFVSGQSKAADQTLKKGWYRFTIGHGTMPLYEPDTNHGGQAYPSWMLGELPDEDEGEAERTAKFAGTTAVKTIRVKNCGEHYTYWLQPSASAQYVYSIDTDVCLHARHLSEEWRNMFYVSESEDDLHSDYLMGKDWYRFTTGFQMMAESPPGPRYSCGTTYAGYLNQAHPSVEDGVVPREVCWKEDEEDLIYQACFQVENIRVKNCGDYYAYQLNPTIKEAAYCVYNRKTSCEPKVVHAKYGELAVVNCTLNSEKDFDSSEVEWTKLNSVALPDDSLKNIEISEDSLLLNINDIADQNAGVYALYIPSTATSELVEVILYSAVEAAQKYYIVAEGGEVQIDVEFNVVPAPAAAKIEWKKLPNKKLTGDKYVLNDEKSSLTIKGVSASETGTYRVSVEFVVGEKTYTKHSDVIVQLEEKEEAAGLVM